MMGREMIVKYDVLALAHENLGTNVGLVMLISRISPTPQMLDPEDLQDGHDVEIWKMVEGEFGLCQSMANGGMPTRFQS